MNRVADLHIHTLESDGTFTPTEVVLKARDQKLDAIAITDHDSVKALDEARESAQSLGIEMIAGIELSAYVDDCEVHILGYCFDDKDPVLLGKLQLLREVREQRIFEIVKKLQALNFDVHAEDIFLLVGKGVPGRLHVARTLVAKKIVGSIAEAFKRFLTPGKPAYVPKEKLSTGEVIRLILQAGGVPVLAHPGLMKRDDLIPKLLNEGLKGIEVYHSEHVTEKQRHYLEIAKNFGLIVTGGSDCHGLAKGKMLLGTVKIPYDLLELLKHASRNYKEGLIHG